MAPASVEGRNQLGPNRRGFQVDKLRWECPIPQGSGLQKLMAQEHIAGMLNAVESAVQNGHRAWKGILERQGFRSTKFCKIGLPNLWRWKPGCQTSKGQEQGKPVNTTDSSTSNGTFQDATTANPLYAAGNGSQEMEEEVGSRFRFPEIPAFEVSSSGPVTREELGRATWTFLHTLAAQFPENPTRHQQRDVKELMNIMTRLYPCKSCSDHFKEVLKAYPVRADSGVELAQWMCQVHNVVNRSLGKPQFPCQRVDARWGGLHCDEGACDLEGRALYK